MSSDSLSLKSDIKSLKDFTEVTVIEIPTILTPLKKGNDHPPKPTELSWLRKAHIMTAGIICTFNGNLGSSIPSGAAVAITEHFAITNSTHLVFLNSSYLAGYIFGPLFFGPMSEYFGRRPILVSSYIGYIVFMTMCAFAPSYAVLVIGRLLCGINASAPATVVGGMYSDIFDNPSHRGTALSLYLTLTTIGPLIGPIISGFASQISWRWPFYVAVVMGLVGLPLVLVLPETFAPVLQHKATQKYRRQDKEANEIQYTAEVQILSLRQTFIRPAKLIATEPVLLFASLYIALAYAIMYLTFQAYPIIFQRYYNLSAGIASFAYIPTIIGVIIAFFISVTYTWWHDKSTLAGKEWAKNEAYRRLPVACFGSPWIAIALFWLGWTTFPEKLAPIVPMMGGLFFGLGSLLVFIAMINYITDIYRDMSASAHAAASVIRSLGAVLLPLAAEPAYKELGIHWAPSILGFVALFMGIIPFIFIKYGNVLVQMGRKL